MYKGVDTILLKKIALRIKKLREKHQLTQEQFIDLCILFGCDYCPNIIDIKQQDIYETYIKYA